MSLRFEYTPARVCHFSSPSLDNLQTWTALTWIYMTTFSAWMGVMEKRDVSNTGSRNFGAADVSGTVNVFIRRDPTNDDFNAANTAFVAGQWCYLAITYDMNAASGSRVAVYSSTISGTVSSHGTGGTGSGTLKDDSAGCLWMGGAYNAAWVARAKIAHFSHWNRVLTLDEIKAQKFNLKYPIANGCVLFCNYGAGYGKQAIQEDLSGWNNHGTPWPGVSVSDNPPLSQEMFAQAPKLSKHPMFMRYPVGFHTIARP